MTHLFLFSFVLCFNTEIYRLPGTLLILKEEQAKKTEKEDIYEEGEAGNYVTRREVLTFCFSFGPPVDCCFCYVSTASIKTFFFLE